MFRFPKIIFLPVTLLFGGFMLTAQESMSRSTADAGQYLSARGELIIRFEKPSSLSLDHITTFLSIDDVRNDTVTAYVNEVGFTWFLEQNIPYVVVKPPSLRAPFLTRGKTATADWNGQYPSYPEYIELMEKFETDFPELCHLTQFGTSIEGRKLLALKITNNPRIVEKEPVILYSSTIHGDEPLGYVLMLRLIDYLLVNYQSNPEIRDLVDRVEIWINPLANPDGTYFMSDTSVFGATRFNAGQVDLNRDFPDIRSDVWKTVQKQQETTAMMNFMESIHPVLSANFHGGAEVVNYPMDSWSRLHADDGWYRMISRTYADTAQLYGSTGYMTYLDNGITNGHAWYAVYGGRQDYTNVLLHGREVTIEMSNDKIPPEDNLDDYWRSNKPGLLQFIRQALTGVTGVITDSLTGFPLTAEIRVHNHDYDSSYAVSREGDGVFFRLISEGDYLLQVSSAGYKTKNMPVSVTGGMLSEMNFRMIPNSEWEIYPNPFTHSLFMYIEEPSDELVLEFTDMLGRIVNHTSRHIHSSGIQEISLDRLPPGFYILNVYYGNQTMKRLVIQSVF